MTYYIIIAYISTVAASHINEHVKKDILRGELSARLLKPFNYVLFRTLQETSYRTIYIVISSTILLLLFLFGSHYLIFPSSPLTVAFFVLSLISAFMIFHCFELIIGLSSFWWGENSALRQAYFTTSIVLSGEIAPLVFFPPIFQRANHYLPFQYLFSFPTQIYLNKLTGLELVDGFLGVSVWILILATVVYILWKRGVHDYDGGSL